MQTPRIALAIALAGALAGGASRAGELAPWDEPRVAALAKQLEDRTRALYDAIFKQPEPVLGPQRRDYFRLKQEVRHLKNEARDFAGDLAGGGSMEQTLPGYEALMSSARWASQAGRSVFTVKDVNDRASEVRKLLNELSPYYDPDAPHLDRPRGR
jgi:hypothetical protein